MAEETFGQMLMTVRSTLAPYKGLIEKIEYAIEAAHLAQAEIVSLDQEKLRLRTEREELAKRLAGVQDETAKYEKDRDAFIALKEKAINRALSVLAERQAEADMAYDNKMESYQASYEAVEEQHKQRCAELDAKILSLTETRNSLQVEVDKLASRLKDILG